MQLFSHVFIQTHTHTHTHTHIHVQKHFHPGVLNNRKHIISCPSTLNIIVFIKLFRDITAHSLLTLLFYHIEDFFVPPLTEVGELLLDFAIWLSTHIMPASRAGTGKRGGGTKSAEQVVPVRQK